MSRVNSLSLPDRGPGSPREKLIPYPGGLKANHIFAGPGARPEPYASYVAPRVRPIFYLRRSTRDGNEPLGHKSQE